MRHILVETVEHFYRFHRLVQLCLGSVALRFCCRAVPPSTALMDLPGYSVVIAVFSISTRMDLRYL